jgi:hypothetical protein
MRNTFIRALGSSAAIAALTLGGAAPALAAKRHHRHHRHHATHKITNSASTSSTSTQSSETALTGTELSSASAAAIAAVPSGTVTRASTETDNSNASAAYEVRVTKTDGSHVVVIEDSSFTVLSTSAAQAGDNCGQAAGGGTQGS